MAGLDVEKFLTTDDETIRSRILATARAATELRKIEAEHLAVQIANKVVKAVNGG